MMTNLIEQLNREGEIAGNAIAAMERLLPPGWTVRWMPAGAPATKRGFDGLIQIASPSASIELRTEIVSSAYPMRSVKRIAAEPDRTVDLLVAPWLDKNVRSRLEDVGLSYLDGSGNARIAIEDPPLFVRIDGSWARPKAPAKQPAMSTLRGGAASRVVRALVDLRLPVPLTTYELAAIAGVSQSQVWRVVDLLAREGTVERDEAARIAGYDWERVLERWVDDYSRGNLNQAGIIRCSTLQGTADVLERLPDITDVSVAVSGSFAAARYAPLAQPKQLRIYTSDPESLRRSLRLIETTSPPEVILVQPKLDVVFERLVTSDGIPCCAPAQVYADLARERSRARDQAEELLRWMREDESWRAS